MSNPTQSPTQNAGTTEAAGAEGVAATGHTPGPWRCEYMGRKSWAILCPAGIRTDSRNTEIVAEITDPIEYMTAAENRANGNLIAAAPDLYTELAKCVKLLDAISRPATRTEVAAESPALWARCIQVSAEARATLAKARPPSA